MKKSLLSYLFVLGLLTITVACSSDDDDSVANLTSDEILALLKGKWEVRGEARVSTNYDLYRENNFEDRYKGIIDFKDNHIFTFKVTESEKENDVVHGEYFRCNVEQLVDGLYENYYILKKDGGNYISFQSSSTAEPFKIFKIVSLKKNSLKLVMDISRSVTTDSGEHYYYKCYMTMFSN